MYHLFGFEKFSKKKKKRRAPSFVLLIRFAHLVGTFFTLQ